MTGEGVASVSVRQASVFLEYSLTYTGGQVMIVIEAQSIDMKEFEVHVSQKPILCSRVLSSCT